MIKGLFKIFIYLLVISGIGIFLGYKYYQNILNKTLSDDPTKKVFVIEDGMTADSVLLKLKTEKVINENQELALKIYVRYERKPEFKEGTFKIPLNINPKQLTDLLENPEITDIWVTIPEGLRKDEIAKIIAKEYKGKEGAVFSEKEFLTLAKNKEYIYQLGLVNVTDLEGYLFPDKYLLPAQATTDYVIRTLIDNFNKKAKSITYKQLIIASMIEREGLSDSDRPMISDVISKRLKEGWLLQIDATLLYYYKDWKHEITVMDKEVDQPYNTYKRLGLPITPICNPGLSAINAALSPKKNPYYYYIHDNNGNVYFAKTLGEHEANIANYLR